MTRFVTHRPPSVRLDGSGARRDFARAMKSTLPLSAAAALLALAACKQSPQIVDSNPDPMASELANKAPIALPPAIKAEKTLRCKDNSLVYVTFFEGDQQAIVKTDKTGAGTVLKAAAKGEPLVADGGWSMTGTPDSVSLTQPGKGALTCHT